MSDSWLTVDCGNSRCKLVIWTVVPSARPQVAARTILATDTGLVAAAVAWLDERGWGHAAALTSVGPEAITADLRTALARGSEVFLDEPEPHLEIRCDPPEGVGRDRLYSARGAVEALGRSAIVVDAGTALTVDAVAMPGIFLGGAIAPGPTLSAAALAQHTARLPRVDPAPGAPALGRNTVGAIRAGVVVGFRGAAGLLVEAIAAEAGLADAPIALGGGARAFLLEPTPFSSREILELPDLVHLGLFHAARRHAQGE